MYHQISYNLYLCGKFGSSVSIAEIAAQLCIINKGVKSEQICKSLIVQLQSHTHVHKILCVSCISLAMRIT